MSNNNEIQETMFNTKPKIRIAKAIFKDKDGNIVGEYNNEHDRYKTG